MTRRCLVTGGAGFIGSHLVDRLVAEKHAVTVLDDFSTGELANLREAQSGGDVRIVRGSILDLRAVEEAIVGCNLVFHLAVQCVRRSLGAPLQNHDINATGTLNVLEVARRHQVRRFVYCSSSEVYGNCVAASLDETTTVCNPTTVYGAAKLAGEHYAKAYWQTYGLPTVIVRPFNTYGPREHMRGDLAEVIPRFVIRVLNGRPPVIFGTGENGRDFTFVTETVQGIAIAANCEALIGSVINIAYGKMVTVRQLAQAVARLCGRPEITPVFIEPRPGDVRALSANTQLARGALGFVAKIDLDQGLRRYIDWFRANHANAVEFLDDNIRNWRLPSDCGDGIAQPAAR
ncbi:MAG: NAD-dependent epimerase/dehydratase family protein [Acetobacteraceae bacterium]|nr:NAD-dependent epimerase/dehydratase family protein [Acetobacteraceae bacterium]